MGVNSTETVQLIRRCRAFDQHAVEELVRCYQPAVFRMALSILDDEAEAEEAAQDSLVRALGALSSYRGEAAFTTWLYTITLNVCRGRLRQRRAWGRLVEGLRTLLHLEQAGQELAPEIAVLRREVDEGVWKALEALPENLRLPVVLRYYHDLPVADMATILGVSERTVHTRLRTAHERLRILLKDKPR
jgi:RNA polymerase sigma-70 factor (ECF subfamily)